MFSGYLLTLVKNLCSTWLMPLGAVNFLSNPWLNFLGRFHDPQLQMGPYSLPRGQHLQAHENKNLCLSINLGIPGQQGSAWVFSDKS